MFFNYISFPHFLVSLAIGLLVVYVSQPRATTIYVYPTPENVSKIQYKDKADNCFDFSYSEVKCPSNANDIFKIPMQN
jgi:hypothetical protein